MARKREGKVERSEKNAAHKTKCEAAATGQQLDFVSMRQQLATMGLALREIAGDGWEIFFNAYFIIIHDQFYNLI